MAAIPKECPAGRVLIVEDEFLVALQIEDVLEDMGYSVIGTVPDSASVLNIQEAPDVALVDLNLRDGLTGPQIARDLSCRFGCKVVYVTANPAEIDLPASTAVGVVQKPFSQSAIVGAVRYALSGEPGARPIGLEPI